MTAFYNEHDPAAAAWLRELIDAGHLPPGVVDTRDIQQLREVDLGVFTQVHLFAGIGGWPLALRLAGWPDDRPVWTGSCPCQPFSSAGRQKGAKDARHLWPWMRHLLFRWRPPVAFGEQVASGLGRQWLAGVRANLETLGYAVGAADLCAASVAAPHIRQRLWWVADATSGGQREQRGADLAGRGRHADGGFQTGRLGDALLPRLEGYAGHGDDGDQPGRLGAGAAGSTAAAGAVGGVADAVGRLAGDRDVQRGREQRQQQANGGAGFWSTFDLIPCRDGKARRVEPGTFPLAHGVPGRVGLLRGYGNAIMPPLAAAFVTAYLESLPSGCAGLHPPAHSSPAPRGAACRHAAPGGGWALTLQGR